MGKHGEGVHDLVIIILRRVGCRCSELVDIVSTLCGWTLVGCMLPLEICLALVFWRSPHFSKVVFSHVAIGAVGAWLRGWAILAGVSGTSTPSTFCLRQRGFVSQSIDLFFNFRGSRMHDGYVGVVCCLPGFCSSKLFFKRVGRFTIFFVVAKKDFPQILVVNASAQTVTHEFL